MMIHNSNRRKNVSESDQSSSSSDSSIYAAFAAARRGAVARGATGVDWGSSIKISSSLLSTTFFAGAFFGGGFVLPEALRAVVLDAGLAAVLDAPGFLSKKSVTEAWAVGFGFLATFMYPSLSSSSLSMLVRRIPQLNGVS
jgi:hypothetical protein